jgi:hypothetical protein
MFGFSIVQLLLLIISSISIGVVSYSHASFLFKVTLIGFIVVAMRNLVLN